MQQYDYSKLYIKLHIKATANDVFTQPINLVSPFNKLSLKLKIRICLSFRRLFMLHQILHTVNRFTKRRLCQVFDALFLINYHHIGFAFNTERNKTKTVRRQQKFLYL